MTAERVYVPERTVKSVTQFRFRVGEIRHESVVRETGSRSADGVMRVGGGFHGEIIRPRVVIIPIDAVTVCGIVGGREIIVSVRAVAS